MSKQANHKTITLINSEDNPTFNFFIDVYTEYVLETYTIDACKAMQPYKPDWRQLHRLGRKYFYDPHVLQYLQCAAESISVEPFEGISAVFRLMTKFETGKVLAMGGFGSVFFMNENFIVKVPHTKEKKRHKKKDYEFAKQQIKREFIVGTVLNKLNLLNLMKTYSLVKAPLPEYTILPNDDERLQDKKVESIGLSHVKAGETNLSVHYLLLEYIKGGKDFYHFVKNIWSRRSMFHELIVCCLQVIYTVWIAFSKVGFVHNDLHTRNILVIELNDYMYVSYDLPNGDTVVLYTPYLIKIIDYGLAVINLDITKMDKKVFKEFKELGKYKNKEVLRFSTGEFEQSLDFQAKVGDYDSIPIDAQLKTPFFDLFRFFRSVMSDIADTDLFRPFTTFVQYISYLSVFWDENRKFIDYEYQPDPKESDFWQQYYQREFDNFYEFGYMPRKMVRLAEKKLSMREYNEYLQIILFDYFHVNYVFYHSMHPNSVDKNRFFTESARNDLLWLTCNERHVKNLEQKGFTGRHACVPKRQVEFTAYDKNKYDVNTVWDSYKRKLIDFEQLKGDFKGEELFFTSLKQMREDIEELEGIRLNKLPYKEYPNQVMELHMNTYVRKITLTSIIELGKKLGLLKNKITNDDVNDLKARLLKFSEGFKRQYGYF